MGTLKDEEFEKLDYLSQLTEIVIAPQNEILASLPDRIELTFEQLYEHKNMDWSGYGFYITSDSILRSLMADEQHYMIDDINKCFTLQVSEDFQLDLHNKTLQGSMSLVKQISQLEDKEILEMAVNKACNNLRAYNWPSKKLREKVVTVLNIFEPGSGDEWIKGVTGRISYASEEILHKTFQTAILENKWRIRNVKVIHQVGNWIDSYLSRENDENSLGLVNLIKLKIMLDKDLPIYSVDEVKNAQRT